MITGKGPLLVADFYGPRSSLLEVVKGLEVVCHVYPAIAGMTMILGESLEVMRVIGGAVEYDEALRLVAVTAP